MSPLVVGVVGKERWWPGGGGLRGLELLPLVEGELLRHAGLVPGPNVELVVVVEGLARAAAVGQVDLRGPVEVVVADGRDDHGLADVRARPPGLEVLVRRRLDGPEDVPREVLDGQHAGRPEGLLAVGGRRDHEDVDALGRRVRGLVVVVGQDVDAVRRDAHDLPASEVLAGVLCERSEEVVSVDELLAHWFDLRSARRKRESTYGKELIGFRTSSL